MGVELVRLLNKIKTKTTCNKTVNTNVITLLLLLQTGNIYLKIQNKKENGRKFSIIDDLA
jgi:hypothetical protein